MSGTSAEPRGWLKNTTRTSTVPTKGWRVYGPDGIWRHDDTLTITSGPLETTCDNIRVAVHGAAASLYSNSSGIFSRVDRWHNDVLYLSTAITDYCMLITEVVGE